ncbi:MAG: membrane protease subunit [Pseudomonadota bacterium]
MGNSFGSSAAIGLLLFLGVGSCAYAWPNYNVWAKGMQGRAELKQAEQNRQIRIEEAQAELEAAKLDALAEIERAKGVAEANKIIADGLGGAEGYLRYLWINQLSRNNQNVIYVPTEAGIPILEAGNRSGSNPASE